MDSGPPGESPEGAGQGRQIGRTLNPERVKEEVEIMNLIEFKQRAEDVKPGVGIEPETQEILVRIKRGGRKKDHHARVKYICSGTLGIGDGRNYTEITAEYI